MRWRLQWATAAAILVIAVTGVARVPVMTERFWNIDEAISACVANTIVEGGLPYRDSVDHRGPLTYYAYAVVFKLFGRNNMDAVHASLAVLVMAIAALLYWICARCATRRAGIITVVFFALLSYVPFQPHDMLAANTEWYQITFTLIGVACLIAGLPSGRPGLLLLSGVCYGLGYLSKQPALFDFAGAIGYLTLTALFRKASFRVLGERVGWLFGGFLLVNAIVLGYFAMRSALPEFIFYFWTFNTKYYLPAVSWSERFAAYGRVAAQLVSNFAPYIALFVTGVARQGYRFWKSDKNADQTQFLFVCWALASWVGTLLSGRDFGHYFIQVLPAVCLVSACVFDDMLRWTERGLGGNQIGERGSSSRLAPKVASAAVVVSTVALLLPVHEAGRRFGLLCAPAKPALPLSVVRDDAEKALVATIRQFAPPETSIFIWGWYAELYVLADRPPASRYAAANALTGMIPWENVRYGIDTTYAIIPGSREIAMRELRRRSPSVIVDTSTAGFRFYGKYSLATFPELDEFVRERYALVREVPNVCGEGNFRVFARREANASLPATSGTPN